MPFKDPERDQLGVWEESRHFQGACLWRYQLYAGQFDRRVGMELSYILAV